MILSTKKLLASQREIFLESGVKFVDYDAIRIKLIDFEAPAEIENAIFTSKNAVEAFFSTHNLTSSQIKHVFCVGEKTKSLLAKNELKVTKMAKNASELVKYLLKHEKNASFYFFCGSRRRDEIPFGLKKAKIELFEVKTYETELKVRKFDQKWSGILFFSPSGVESYISENNLENSVCVCIGETTASTVKKHTDNVVIADESNVESVIEKAILTIK